MNTTTPEQIIEHAPVKAQPWLRRAVAHGLAVEQTGPCYFIHRGGHLGSNGHWLYFYVLEGRRGGNLRAYLGGRIRRGATSTRGTDRLKDQRLSKASLGTWIDILGESAK